MEGPRDPGIYCCLWPWAPSHLYLGRPAEETPEGAALVAPGFPSLTLTIERCLAWTGPPLPISHISVKSAGSPLEDIAPGEEVSAGNLTLWEVK